MDYKEQVALIRGLAYEWNKCSHITKIGGMKLEEFLLLTATAITDLLARCEAAEAHVRELETSFRTEKCENGPECAELGRVRKALAEAEARAEKAKMERDAYKIFFDDVSSKPDCNTCCLKQCEYRPEIGQTTRFNCPLWRGKKEE